VGIVALRVTDAPHWTPVYTNVTPASAGAMSRVLKSAAIPYTLAAGGTSLLVPAADVNQARVDLAEHNLPASNTATLPKAPKFSLGETDSEVTAVQQTDLEDTLDTTIASIAGVTAANVLITEPPTTLFGESGTSPTASVFVTVAPNSTLSRAQVTGIQHLVAAAVNGLTPANVDVINQAGDWLSNPSAPAAHPSTGSSAVTSQLAATNAVNQSMTTQVLNVLDPMFGPGNVVAHVQAQLNFISSTVHRVSYAKGIPTAQQVKTSHSKTAATTTATKGAGAAANTPTYPTVGTTTTGPATSSSSDRISHYAVGQTTQTVSNPGGSITGLTVAVAVNQRLSPATIRAVQTLVRQTVGLPAALQVSHITVTAMPFNHQAATLADRAEAAAAKAAAAQQRRIEEELAGAVAAFLLLLFLLFRRRKPPVVQPAPESVMAPAMTFTEDEVQPEAIDTLSALQDHLRSAAGDHADALAKVVQTLVESEGEG